MAAAERAVALDSELAEAQTSLAHARLHTGDFAGAEAAFKRAIGLRPTYATARFWYAELLLDRGRTAEALSEEKRALELDPLDLAINAGLAEYFRAAGRFEEALAQYRKTLEIKANYYFARAGLGDTYFALGRYEDAAGEYQQVVDLTKGNRGYAGLIRAYNRMGRREDARRLVGKLLAQARQKYVDPVDLAAVYTELEDKDQAFVWLARAVDEDPQAAPRILRRPSLAPLRSDPRYEALLRRLGAARGPL
jgi:tetratricopeptide (TPR) repeat protein